MRSMTDQGSSATTPDARVVRRALWIAVGWSYVAALGSALVVGLTALIALIVDLVASLSADRGFDASSAWSLAEIVAWIALPIGLAVSVWVAAYGSTRRGSLKSGTIAVAAAAVAGAIAWFTGNLAIVVVGLGVGWAVAMPAEHPARWILRLLPAVALLFVYPDWDGEAAWLIALALITGPLVGGLCVILGDLVWTVVQRLRIRGSGETVRSPTSLDV